MGPRVKTWGFLAHPDGHTYSTETSTDLDHYSRKGVVKRLISSNMESFVSSADVNFNSDVLEYRPFTSRIEAR
jgi:hypothetical protein